MNASQLGQLLAEVREYRASLEQLPTGDMLGQMMGRVDDYVAAIGNALYDLGSEIPEPSPVPEVAPEPEPAPGEPPRRRSEGVRFAAGWRQPRLLVGSALLLAAAVLLIVTLVSSGSTESPLMSVTVQPLALPTSQPCDIKLSYQVQVFHVGSLEDAAISLTLAGKDAPHTVSPQRTSHPGSGIVHAVFTTAEPGSAWGAVGPNCAGRLPVLWTVSQVTIGSCSLDAPSDTPRVAKCS